MASLIVDKATKVQSVAMAEACYRSEPRPACFFEPCKDPRTTPKEYLGFSCLLCTANVGSQAAQPHLEDGTTYQPLRPTQLDRSKSTTRSDALAWSPARLMNLLSALRDDCRGLGNSRYGPVARTGPLCLRTLANILSFDHPIVAVLLISGRHRAPQ